MNSKQKKEPPYAAHALTREVLQQLLNLPEAELQALQAKGVLTLPA